MASEAYPSDSVRALLRTDLVTTPTRAVLEARLDAPPTHVPQFFTVSEFATLTAVGACLLPPLPGELTLSFVVGQIDARLAAETCDGWRYDALPPDSEAYRRGLRGLDESAQSQHDSNFVLLSPSQQKDLLETVRRGKAPGDVWTQMPGARWLEDLLTELAQCVYSDPRVQEQIGYVGMADAHGWQKIGLNEREGPRDEEGRGSPAPSPSPRLAPKPIPPREVVDAVIIGTGAGGAPLLARLAQAGLSVVALEAGKFWDPARDFATDERAQEKLFWNDERLSAGQDPIAFGGNNSGTGVGGSTLHYTAYTPRAHPDDFQLQTEFGVGNDWPLGYQDLEPYYDELEQFLGVSGPSPYPWGPPRRTAYPIPPLPLNGAAQLMQRACARLGIQTSPAANAALSAPRFQPGLGWRPACTNRGFCQAGCSTGAKASMDVTFLPLALSHGAEIRSECFVTGIETDKTGRVTGVVYVQNGREQRQSCRAVFLCAGAIESPRLLLLNKLANASGEVGRNFLAHAGLQLWGQFEDEVRPFKGIPAGLISEDTHRPPDADFAGGYLLQSIGVMPVTYASQAARGLGLWGEALGAHLRGYNHTAGINILGECLPSARNFLELSGEADARGLPKPRVHFTAGENERRLTAHGERTMRAIWDAAGARDVWAFPRFAHTLGTCRMGDDPAASVVNADACCHDVPNLYVMDGSVFPSALSVNPALTIMALSLRAADRFLERLRCGEG